METKVKMEKNQEASLNLYLFFFTSYIFYSLFFFLGFLFF